MTQILEFNVHIILMQIKYIVELLILKNIIKSKKINEKSSFNDSTCPTKLATSKATYLTNLNLSKKIK